MKEACLGYVIKAALCEELEHEIDGATLKKLIEVLQRECDNMIEQEAEQYYYKMSNQI